MLIMLEDFKGRNDILKKIQRRISVNLCIDNFTISGTTIHLLFSKLLIFVLETSKWILSEQLILQEMSSR